VRLDVRTRPQVTRQGRRHSDRRFPFGHQVFDEVTDPLSVSPESVLTLAVPFELDQPLADLGPGDFTGSIDSRIAGKLLQDVAASVGGDFAQRVLGAALAFFQILIDQTVDLAFPGSRFIWGVSFCCD
jgi:hypothetical protein